MSDHSWTEEHVAAYLAGGLTAPEAERLEAHVEQCEDCSDLLTTSRGLERDLNCLFTDVRPGPELEDGVVNHLRTSSPTLRTPLFSRWSARAAAAVAAVFLLGAFGALASTVAKDGLPMPGSPGAMNLFSRADRAHSGVETTKVLVAAKELTTGTAFTKSNVGELTAYKDVPKTSISPEAKLILNPDDLVGKRLSRATHEGEFFNVADVSVKTQIMFEAGQDIMSIPMTAAKAASGFVGPGSRVDIVGSVVEGNTRRVFTLLPDVQVLAVDAEQDLTTKQVFPEMRSVSFPVDQKQALLITLANQRNANLELVLRHPDAPLRHPTPEAREKALKDTLAMLANIGKEPEQKELTVMERRPVVQSNEFPTPQFDPIAKPDGGSTYSSFPGKSGATQFGFYDLYRKSPIPTMASGSELGYMGPGPITGSASPPPADLLPIEKPPVALGVKTENTESAPGPREPKKEAPPVAVPAVPPAAEPNPEPAKRVILRSGTIEFEVPSFDAAAAAITKSVTGLKGAFIATINSDKLPNGKVKGSITVRIPPEHLDTLVLELRKELGKDGELKGVRIASQDVTKQYTDLESHLRAFRTMETRLIQIIKEGKGEIKQLLEAERELGIWRTKIEEAEGELRYYANLAALSTLTITITEKELRAAVSLTESERVQAGVEVDDVDKTYQEVLKAILEAKGRITKSEVKQLAAGQFNASLNFEVPPEASGAIRDRLKQLGRIARLEIDRLQHIDGGTLPSDAKTKRGDTVFIVSLYNLANVAPRETAMLQIAVAEVPAAFQTLRDVVGKTTSRVFTAKFDEQDKQNITAQLDFEVRRTDEAVVRAALDAAGETFSRQLTRSPESDNVTDTKVLYRIMILSMGRLRPRETSTLNVAVVDVPAAYQSLRDAIAKANGRILNAQIDEHDRQNITATLDLDVKRSDEPAIRAAFDTAGEVLARQVNRAGESENVTDSKVRYTATLVPANRLKPRETTTLGIEVANVDEAATLFAAQATEVKGRQADAKFSRESSGKTLAKLVFEVPLTAAPGLVDRFKAAGTVRSSQSVRDPQASEGRFATARIEVTLGNREGIVSDENGLWSQVRRGLSYSATVLLTSVTWVVFGLCVILPWAVVSYVAYRVLRRAFYTTPATETVPPPAAPPAATA